MNDKICKTTGCNNRVNRVSYELCEACYMRYRRKGTTEYCKPKERIIHTGGYILIRKSNHPLCKNRNYQYEHRIVFYDNYGEGPFPCNWCNKTVTWNDLHVDHLNDNKSDNRIENLVASCAICNQARGRDKMIKTVREKRAIIITFKDKTQTLLEWANDIGIARNTLKNRLNSGWSLELALTEPRGRTGPKREVISR